MQNKIFIIAEIGINANGDINIAKKLMKGAKESGADSVKFQKRTIERVYSKEELDKLRDSPWGITNRQQKLGLEFTEKGYDEINKYARELDIDWFASCWDLNSVDFLKKYNLKYNKIASPMLTHLELLSKVAEQRKYTFISTGMSTMEEIDVAIKIFKKNSCPFELMHCNSTYPCKDEDLNLLNIKTLGFTYDCKVGYSAHSPGIMDGVLAVALGASSVEKHITLDRTMYGSDQASSLEIHGFAKMVEYIRFAEIAMGTGIKTVTIEEEKIKSKLRHNKDF